MHICQVMPRTDYSKFSLTTFIYPHVRLKTCHFSLTRALFKNASLKTAHASWSYQLFNKEKLLVCTAVTPVFRFKILHIDIQVLLFLVQEKLSIFFLQTCQRLLVYTELNFVATCDADYFKELFQFDLCIVSFIF